MTDAAPYRQPPKFLLCPRCGEMLERAFDAVLVCLRCEGVWITPATLAAAFGDPRWPVAQTMWWRNEIECPECATGGTVTVMTAMNASGTQIDRCPEHGLWLDRGELGRLMGGGDDELAALRDRISRGGPELEQLARRREAWRSSAESRRAAADEHRRSLEDEDRRRRAAAAAQARTRLPHGLDDARADAEAEIGRHEAELVVLREQVRATEAELDAARARLRAIDDQQHTGR